MTILVYWRRNIWQLVYYCITLLHNMLYSAVFSLYLILFKLLIIHVCPLKQAHQPAVRGTRQMADLDEDLMNGLTSNGLRGRLSSMLQVLRAHLLLLLLVILSTSLLFQACHPHLRIALWHIIILVWKKKPCSVYFAPLIGWQRRKALLSLYFWGRPCLFKTLACLPTILFSSVPSLPRVPTNSRAWFSIAVCS